MSTDADETVADLHRLFSGLSRLASRMRLRNAMHPGIRNLAQTDAWLLSHLAATGPARMSALAEWQAVDRSTMTAQVKRLERAGLAPSPHRPHRPAGQHRDPDRGRGSGMQRDPQGGLRFLFRRPVRLDPATTSRADRVDDPAEHRPRGAPELISLDRQPRACQQNGPGAFLATS